MAKRSPPPSLTSSSIPAGLFGPTDDPPRRGGPDAAFEAAARPSGPYAQVALEQHVDQTLTYSIPPRLRSALSAGQRVRVPLGRGNRPALGYVVAITPECDYPRLKPILEIDDPRVLVTATMMDLARWMSRYYCAPLGQVIESIIPSAVKKRIGVTYIPTVRLAPDRTAADVQSAIESCRAPKRRAILARLLQLEPGHGIELVRLAAEAGTTAPTIRKLVAAGLIAITRELDLPGWSGDPIAGADAPGADIALNDDQQRVFDELRPRMDQGGFSVNLLFGVTGSGKTEIYLQCIRRVVERGGGAIVLVPEIALTPQTVRRFTSRFGRVAIQHSGLTAAERHRFWQQVSSGNADVVVGARSAVFAPMPRLGVIVVDEEHEASYKQDSAPRYHARDVAIKRAQLEGAPVLLGSATPSLETYRRVTGLSGEEAPAPMKLSSAPPLVPAPRLDRTDSQDRDDEGRELDPSVRPIAAAAPGFPRPISAEPGYHLLSLPHRVRGLKMPHVELVDMKTAGKFRRGVHLISDRLEYLLRAAVQSGHQAILLLNRRGYSNFVYCSSCAEAVGCKYCDATMTYHRSAGESVGSASHDKSLHTGQLHCHYCLAVNPLPAACPTCGHKLSLFGLGTQRVEEEITRKFPELKFARVDSDSMRNSRDYEALLGQFARGELQVMLGTQMIAKGLDYPNVTLVGVISGDTALALPDFRAAERTFQLITQVAGRAGRGDAPGRVVLQTFLPDDPTIQAALRQDYPGFALSELRHRREVGLPPFSRMARIIVRDQEPEKLHEICERLAADVAEEAAREAGRVTVKGPMPCAISRIAGYFRNQIVLSSPGAAALQRVLTTLRERGSLFRHERVAVDVDPVSLL